MCKRYKGVLFTAGMVLLFFLQSCTEGENPDLCGEDIGDTTFNTLPARGYFHILKIDTPNMLATLRFDGPEWKEVCTREAVSLTVNAQGSFTEMKACLRWNTTDSILFSVKNTGPNWTGHSDSKDIAGMYKEVPAILNVLVDFTFPYTDSSLTLATLHQQLSDRFTGLYIDPIAKHYK